MEETHWSEETEETAKRALGIVEDVVRDIPEDALKPLAAQFAEKTARDPDYVGHVFELARENAPALERR